MNSVPPYDLIIGLDRSDRTADRYLLHPGSGITERQIIPTAPEALHDWLAQLRQQRMVWPRCHGSAIILLSRSASAADIFLRSGLSVSLPTILPPRM